MNSDAAASYRLWQVAQSVVASPMDRTSPYYKYLLSAYHYFRSRLTGPGRAYDTDDTGMLAIGGSAHCDLMDLDVWLSRQDDATRRTAYEWTLDASQEKVAYWHNYARGYSRQSVQRQRQGVADDATAEIDGQKVLPVNLQ